MQRKTSKVDEQYVERLMWSAARVGILMFSVQYFAAQIFAHARAGKILDDAAVAAMQEETQRQLREETKMNDQPIDRAMLEQASAELDMLMDNIILGSPSTGAFPS